MNATQMTRSSIDSAARLLLDARRTGLRLPELPVSLAPTSPGDAYAIQDAVMSAWGRTGGWKVGAKGLSHEPTCAPIAASTIHEGPLALKQNADHLRGVEAELAVRVTKDLPPRPVPYTQGEVAAAIGAVMPSIEVVDSRYIDMRSQGPLALLADGLSNAGLVMGNAVPRLLPADPARQQAEIFFDARRVAGGAGGNAAGDLMRLLTWLANHVARRAGGLRAGQVITTGSWTGLLFAEQKMRVRAVFEGLGEVELTFS